MSQKLNVYSVRDLKGEYYGCPFTSRNHSLASRLFAQCLRSPDFQYFQAPADFALFYLGTFDDACGSFDNVTPQLVITGDHMLEAVARHAANWGGSCGGDTPLKSQSEQELVKADAENIETPACDADTSSSSKAQNKVENSLVENEVTK